MPWVYHPSTFTLHQNRKGIFLLNMGLITLVQGFKLSVAKFDEFLAANGLGPIEGYQPLPDEAVDIAKLFTAKGVDCEVSTTKGVVSRKNCSVTSCGTAMWQ